MSKTTTPASVPSSIRKRLYEKLKDSDFASAYLNEALLEGDEIVFKTAMADVIRARGVVSVAEKAGINRVTIFKTLKPETRTSFVTYHALLKACGIDFGTRAISKRARSAKNRDRRAMPGDLLGQRVGKTSPQSR
jgi:probable addiction module antidote protein